MKFIIGSIFFLFFQSTVVSQVEVHVRSSEDNSNIEGARFLDSDHLVRFVTDEKGVSTFPAGSVQYWKVQAFGYEDTTLFISDKVKEVSLFMHPDIMLNEVEVSTSKLNAFDVYNAFNKASGASALHEDMEKIYSFNYINREKAGRFLESVSGFFSLQIPSFYNSGKNVLRYCKNDLNFNINEKQAADSTFFYWIIGESKMKMLIDATRRRSNSNTLSDHKKKKGELDDLWTMRSSQDTIFFDKQAGTNGKEIIRYNYRTSFRRDSTLARVEWEVYMKKKKAPDWLFTLHESIDYDSLGMLVPTKISSVSEYNYSERPHQVIKMNAELSEEKCTEFYANKNIRFEANWELLRNVARFVDDHFAPERK